MKPNRKPSVNHGRFFHFHGKSRMTGFPFSSAFKKDSATLLFKLFF
ncbi:hypothetical protein HOLDEFILI_03171 [Holdemania filiformis DSM 12042]|uniref:Uncharacterized protein n=1 Tax=Holdemania filiformis DSM 12042 TaxID=545696 RepID=B9YBG4_9FIRM|nr:hypothetical protein HOLDEFILI_03171 [Holdemania filiformis DSM 12042]